jgi:NAD(P)-dependent dehydrogenase (short-subunit alcohol dehydrogenase family)
MLPEVRRQASTKLRPVAVVTVTGRGRGAAEAALLRDWGVVTADMARGVEVLADECDARAWRSLVEGVLERRGGLDGLVNNAAIHHTQPRVGGGMAE